MAEGSGEVSLAELETAFRKFAVYGDTKATGNEMNGKNFVKLCKDCKVIDGKNVTSTDVDIVFSKVKYDYLQTVLYIILCITMDVCMTGPNFVSAHVS